MFCCKQCGKQLANKNSFTQHLQTHDKNRRKFSCQICKQTFLRYDNLRIHLKLTHNVGKSFCYQQCVFCDKIVTNTANLELHFRAHTKERPFFCKICSSSFSNKSHLVTHNESHQSYCDRKYKCELCSKRFTRSTHLETHIRYHTGEKTNKCQTCNESFVTVTDLKYHQRIHTGERAVDVFLCNVCPKKNLSPSSNLKVHLRIHSGEKLFHCKICEKRFTKSGCLTRHMRIHMSEKPFKCKICGKTFADKSNCRRHEITHKPDSHN